MLQFSGPNVIKKKRIYISVSSHNSFSLHFSSLVFLFSNDCRVLCTPTLALLSRTLIPRFNAKSVCGVFKDIYTPFFLSLMAHTVREGNPCSYGHRSNAYQPVPFGMPVFLQQFTPSTGMRRLNRIGLTAGKPAQFAEKYVVLQRRR